MSSTPGPAPNDEPSDEKSEEQRSEEQGEEVSEKRTNEQPDDESDDEPTMDLETLLGILETQAGGVQRAVKSVREEAEPGEELRQGQVNSVRTDVVEFQALVEDLLTQHCADTKPWEYAGEHIPQSRREELLSEV